MKNAYVPDTQICTKCGAHNSESSHYCFYCGTSLQSKCRCGNCGKPLLPSKPVHMQYYCTECGHPVGGKAQKKKTSRILEGLAILYTVFVVS